MNKVSGDHVLTGFARYGQEFGDASPTTACGGWRRRADAVPGRYRLFQTEIRNLQIILICR